MRLVAKKENGNKTGGKWARCGLKSVKESGHLGGGRGGSEVGAAEVKEPVATDLVAVFAAATVVLHPQQIAVVRIEEVLDQQPAVTCTS